MCEPCAIHLVGMSPVAFYMTDGAPKLHSIIHALQHVSSYIESPIYRPTPRHWYHLDTSFCQLWWRSEHLQRVGEAPQTMGATPTVTCLIQIIPASFPERLSGRVSEVRRLVEAASSETKLRVFFCLIGIRLFLSTESYVL